MTLNPLVPSYHPPIDKLPQQAIEVINTLPPLQSLQQPSSQEPSNERQQTKGYTSPNPPSSTAHPPAKAKTAPKQLTLHSFLSLPVPPLLSDVQHGETWGHTMDEIDTSSTFRVLLQNPNGIRPFEKDLEFHYSLCKCQSLGIGAISIAETKLNWSSSAAYTTKQWFH